MNFHTTCKMSTFNLPRLLQLEFILNMQLNIDITTIYLSFGSDFDHNTKSQKVSKYIKTKVGTK